MIAIPVIFLMSLAAAPTTVSVPTPQTHYAYVTIGAMPQYARAGIKSKIKPSEYGRYLFLINPRQEKSSPTGFEIPRNLRSSVRILWNMLPENILNIIKQDWNNKNAFDCPEKIWPRCFSRYYGAMKDSLVEIWGLQGKTRLAKYFRQHGVCVPGRMIAAVTDGLYSELHQDKHIDFNKILEGWATINQERKCSRVNRKD